METDLRNAIAAATHASDFEVLARKIADASTSSPDLVTTLRERLRELNVDLPSWVGSYAREIVESGNPSGEDILKVLSLAKSLEVLTKLNIAGSEERLFQLGAILSKDGRYGTFRASFFGTRELSWWT